MSGDRSGDVCIEICLNLRCETITNDGHCLSYTGINNIASLLDNYSKFELPHSMYCGNLLQLKAYCLDTRSCEGPTCAAPWLIIKVSLPFSVEEAAGSLVGDLRSAQWVVFAKYQWRFRPSY